MKNGLACQLNFSRKIWGPLFFAAVEKAALPALVKIRPDEGIAALDVGRKIGHGALMEKNELVADGLFVLPFEDFKEERKLCHLNGLGIDKLPHVDPEVMI